MTLVALAGGVLGLAGAIYAIMSDRFGERIQLRLIFAGMLVMGAGIALM